MKRGDPVTEYGVWLRATLRELGPEQSIIHMEDAILHGVPKEHICLTKDLIPWSEFQKDRGVAFLRGQKAKVDDAAIVPYQRGGFKYECICGCFFRNYTQLEVHKQKCMEVKNDNERLRCNS